TGEKLFSLRHVSIPGRAISLAYSPDGKQLALGGDFAGVKVFLRDAAMGKMLSTINTGKKEVKGLAYSPDGKRLALAHRESGVTVWNVSTGTLAWGVEELKIDVQYVAFSYDGKHLACFTSDAGLRDAGLDLSPDGKPLGLKLFAQKWLKQEILSSETGEPARAGGVPVGSVPLPPVSNTG